MKLNIVPEPVAIQYKSGLFQSKGLPLVENKSTEGGFQEEVTLFLEQMRRIFKASDKSSKIICKTDASLGAEAYRLHIETEMITLEAGTAAGAYHGLQTIRQLLMGALSAASAAEGILPQGAGEKCLTLPCADIEDYPQFQWRGFMLDCSRYFYTPAFIKKLIDALSLHHISVFHWHLTDDQGWRLPVPEYPLLTEIGSMRQERRKSGQPYIGGFYSEEDIRDIVSFAGDRHIEVVPEVDLPGHASAILASYPGLGCTGGPYRVQDSFGIFEDVLCAGNDGIFNLAEACFDSVSRLFPSKYVHIGGDEVRFNRWENCPKCRKRLEDTGLKAMRELQSWITVQLTNMLAARGKIAVGWDEVLEDTKAYRLPPSVAVMSWRGADAGRQAVKQGYKTIMSPSDQGCYLDYRHIGEPEEPGQYRESTVFQTYTMNPIAGMSATEASLVMGGQCNLWSEIIYAGKIAEYMIFPRIAAFAENMWTPQAGKDFDRFEEKLALHRKRLDMLELGQYRGRLK